MVAGPFLLKMGAEADQQDAVGQTPLMFAAYFGHVEVVKTLILAGVDINRTLNGGMNPLWLATEKDNVETVKTLLRAGAEVDKPNLKNATPLMYAASYHVALVETFLVHGVKLGMRSTIMT